MREFVGDLRKNWNTLAKRQRMRAHSVMLQAASEYLLEWEEFSPDQVDKLEQSATKHPWPLILMQFAPNLCLIFLLPRFPSPTEGWKSQGSVLVILFVEYSLMMLFFPWTIIAMAHLPLSWVFEAKVLLWCFVCGLICTSVVLCVAGGLNIWPVPFVSLIGVIVVSAGLLALWKVLPNGVRHDRHTRRRTLASLFLLYALLTVFGVA